jgi:ATP-dependent RNA helicase RhlE
MTVSVSNGSTGFDRFGLKEALMRGIRHAGFESPRQIQLETIPAGLAGRDVLGLAQTGTGKTAAYALPLLDRLLDERRKGPRALVIAPTRELATQIAAEFRTLSRFTGVKMVTIYGGVPIRSQIDKLARRPEIVVGCPGRVLDLLQRGLLHLGQVETLVLDEADHMFDMGFLPDIRRILAALPARRQNLLFSATMPKDIRRLADDLLTDPHVVELADAAPASTIDHALYLVAEPRKRALLEHLLAGDDCDSAIVFTRTKRRASRLAEQLSKAGHRAVGLQGNMSQGQRDRAMRGFRSRSYDILVATDIAARGIDVSGVSHVINFDVPNTPEAYTHRIGRTGRAELEGVACTFVTSSDRAWVQSTERMIGARIPRREVEGFEPDAEGRSEHRRHHSQSRSNGQPRNNGESRANGQSRSNGQVRRSEQSRSNGQPRSDGQSRSNGQPRNNGGSRSTGQPRSNGGSRSNGKPRSNRRNAGFRPGSRRRA